MFYEYEAYPIFLLIQLILFDFDNENTLKNFHIRTI